MTRIYWWLADRLSRALEPDEREAVCGDLAESGDSAGQAIRNILGLVLRRQSAYWKDWRPWLALLVIPSTGFLIHFSRSMSDNTAITLWHYTNNWDWALVGTTAFQYKFPRIVAGLLASYLTLFCWSWTTGFVVGALSRRAIHVNSALFCVMLSLPLQVFNTPFVREYNAAVFAVTFYRWYLPWIGQALLVLLPALWGMRHGIRLGMLSPLLRTILWTAAIATLAPIVLGAAFSLPAWLRMHRPVLYWPVAYLVAHAIGQRWRGRTPCQFDPRHGR